MTRTHFEIILIACAVSAACSVPGVLLVLRRKAIFSDAIARSVLLGIVIGFAFTQNSLVIVCLAVAVAMLAVRLDRWFYKTHLMERDTAISVIYPLIFSAAIIFISLFSDKTHLDPEAVMAGELAFAPLNRLVFLGKDWGPMILYQIVFLSFVTALFCSLFYKEIKVSIFDKHYASISGFRPQRIMYGIIAVVAATAAVTFEAVGSIMFFAILVGPAIIASYFTQRLGSMLFLAPMVGVIASLMGYFTAYALDVSIMGSIVTAIGVLIVLTILFAPSRGLLASAYGERILRNEFSLNILLVHLWQHEILGDADFENNKQSISMHLNWKEQYLGLIVGYGADRGFWYINSLGMIYLTDSGREHAQRVMGS